MSTTTEKLREAAEHFAKYPSCECDPDSGVFNCMGCDIDRMAQYILATVHPDDFRDEVLASQPKKLNRETSLFDMDEVSSIDQLTESERMTLVIISAWGEGTMIDRLLFGEAAVLWVNDKHRQYRCGESSTPQKRFKPAPDVTQLIGNAVRRCWITPVMRDEIECVKLIINPSPLGPLTDDEEAKRRQICQIVAAELNRTDPRVQKGDDYVRATALFARS